MKLRIILTAALCSALLPAASAMAADTYGDPIFKNESGVVTDKLEAGQMDMQISISSEDKICIIAALYNDDRYIDSVIMSKDETTGDEIYNTSLNIPELSGGEYSVTVMYWNEAQGLVPCRPAYRITEYNASNISGWKTGLDGTAADVDWNSLRNIK